MSTNSNSNPSPSTTTSTSPNKKKETGLLLQINRKGTSISILHHEIERRQAQVQIRELARDGIEARYFPAKTVDQFQNALDHLNQALKRERQRTVRVLPKSRPC